MEISENAGNVLPCQLGETGFYVLKLHIVCQKMLNVMCAPYLSVHMNEPHAIFVVLKGTGSRSHYSLLSILRILIGLRGFILLPTLPPIGLA